jgi:tetratricopeptide (TPR) repeat protein
MKLLLYLTMGLLLFCFSCTSTRTLPAPLAPDDRRNEHVDAGCAYFYFLWGKSAENDRRYDEALQAYEKVLVCDPQTEYVQRSIAMLFIKMDRKREAIEWLNKIVARHPADIHDRILEAKLYTSLGDFEMAIAAYKEILQYHEDQQALLMLGSLYARMKQYDKAQIYLERLAKLDEDSYLGYYYLARLYRELRLYDKSIDYYKKALAVTWTSRLAMETAELYEEQQQFEEAGKLYERIVEEDETDETARTRLVNVYLQMDKVDSALRELKALKVFSDEPEKVDFTIGRLLISRERYDEAIEVLSDLLAENPDHQPARYLLALAYYQKGETKEGMELLRAIPPTAEVYEDAIFLQVRIAREKEDLADAVHILAKAIADESARKMSFYIVLASLYKDSGQPEKGRELLDQAEELYPDNTELLFEYGMFLERIGDQDGALARMQQVLEIEPTNAAALNYVGYTWADRGENLDKALEYIEQAVARQPHDGFIRDSLGWVYFRMGDFKRAIEELGKALELVADDPIIYEHAGDAYLQAGDLTEARTHYEKALEFTTDEKKKGELEQKLEQLKER